MTLNEGLGNLNWNENVEYSGLYGQNKFEINQSVNVQIKLKLIFSPHEITYVQFSPLNVNLMRKMLFPLIQPVPLKGTIRIFNLHCFNITSNFILIS